MRAITNKIIALRGEPLATSNMLVDIESYKDYYPLLDAELFDVVMVRWKDEDISIFVDDEGMLKEGNFGRYVDGYSQPLFGNIVICGGVDDEGNTLPLPEEFTVFNIKEYIGDIQFVTKGL